MDREDGLPVPEVVGVSVAAGDSGEPLAPDGLGRQRIVLEPEPESRLCLATNSCAAERLTRTMPWPLASASTGDAFREQMSTASEESAKRLRSFANAMVCGNEILGIYAGQGR